MIKNILLFLLFLSAGCGRRADPPVHSQGAERIVSMAPNITEILFALGLEDRLVGVTEFCRYPPAAQNLPRVGGFGQFNYEAIVSLRPDLAILHREFQAEKARLEELGIPALETDSYYIEDIFSAIRRIGRACGATSEAGELVRRLEERMDTVNAPAEEGPRVLMAFGGSADDDIGQIHAFGTACLHNQLLKRAGGKNVLNSTQPYALLSREAVLRLDPDIVVVLAPELETRDAEQRRWADFPGLRAAEERRIYVLTGDYLCIPGPRFVRTLEDFSDIIVKNE